MKNIVKTGWILCLLLTLAACEKEEEGPAQTPSAETLESLMAGNYWQEDIHFIYINRDEDELKLEWMQSRPPVSGSLGFPPEVFLDTFYIEPESGRVLKYDYTTTAETGKVYNGYYANWFTIEYDEANRSIRFIPHNQKLSFMNAVAGLELKLIEQTEWNLTFQAPIKSFVHDYFMLEYDFYKKKIYLGLQVQFKRISNSEQFENVQQLD